VRGGASVVAQAPNAKRALERFVHEMHSLFLRAGEPPEAITVSRDMVWPHASTKT
jgi:acyl-CoA thioesterase